MKHMHLNLCRVLSVAALTAFMALAPLSNAWAGTPSTWSGSGTNGNWSTSGNWSSALNNSGTFSLTFSGSTRTSGTNNIGGTSATVTVDSMLFSNNNTGSNTGAFTVNSSNSRSITLTNGATITTTAASTGSLTDTFNSRLVASGTINFNLGSNHHVNFVPTAYTGSPTIVKSGAGNLSLGGSATRTYGGLTVNQGGVFLNTTAATAGLAGQTVSIGTGTSTGAVRFNTASATGSTDIKFALNNNSTVTAEGGAAMVFTSSQFNAATAATSPVTLTLSGAGSKQTQVVQGAIVDNTSNPVSLSVSGSHTWVLQGANTYTGATVVGSAAKVLLDGSIGPGNTTVSGLLAGSGTASGAVTVSGTITPGGTASAGGVITDSIASLDVGSLSMTPSATALLSITGTDSASYDQINGSSTMTFDGTLGLSLAGSYDTTQLWVDQQVWNLFNGFTSYTAGLDTITFDGTGTPFAGMQFALTGTAGIWQTTTATADVMGLKLQFNENNGQLAVVPEPSTMVFAGIGMAMFGWRSWTSRRRRMQREQIAAAKA